MRDKGGLCENEIGVRGTREGCVRWMRECCVRVMREGCGGWIERDEGGGLCQR